MDLNGSTVVVTGGAGFIGSELVGRLHPENDVRVVDDLSAGDPDRLPDGVELHRADVLDDDTLDDALSPEVDVVFHLAADPDVRTSVDDPDADLRRNAVATNRLLGAIRREDVDSVVFASSSTVYGEAPTPTPETYGPPAPESPYGASKLASEGLCTAYAASYGLDVRVLRLANIVGERGHGVVPDFVRKLEDDPTELEILGDGRQTKSYLHVDDCVEGIVHAAEDDAHTFYNVGNTDAVSVTRIAEVVSDVMDTDPDLAYTGGRRGWTGDVPRMRLDIGRLRGTGWEPGTDSEGAVRRTADSIVG